MTHNWPKDEGPDDDQRPTAGSTLIVLGIAAIVLWVAIIFVLLKLLGVL